MVDVAVNVIRCDGKYLIGKRSSDGYWESQHSSARLLFEQASSRSLCFTGGKVEDESLEDAALRELKEETGLEGEVVKTAPGYPSEADSKFNLRPVLIETGSRDIQNSREHEKLEWIDLNDFYRYDTLGQFPALERLGVVNGDVALTVPRKNNRYLVLKRSEKISSSGLWNFPGGKIEDDDRAGEALRELEEETGLQGEIIERGNPYIGDGELGYWRIFPFLVEAEGEPELNYEHSDFRWITLGELENMETLGALQALEKLELDDGL